MYPQSQRKTPQEGRDLFLYYFTATTMMMLPNKTHDNHDIDGHVLRPAQTWQRQFWLGEKRPSQFSRARGTIHPLIGPSRSTNDPSWTAGLFRHHESSSTANGYSKG